MKHIVTCCILLWGLPVAAQESKPADPAVQAEQYYRHGLAAVKRGDGAAARRSFELALRLNPGHANARYQLLALRGQDGKLAGRAREVRLAGVKLAAVDFSGASLGEVLESLDLLVRKQTNDEFSPNFVIQDPTGELAMAKIDIQLRNVPANVVLRYALDQSRAIARYEAHAVLIRPAAPKKANPNEDDPGGG